MATASPQVASPQVPTAPSLPAAAGAAEPKREAEQTATVALERAEASLAEPVLDITPGSPFSKLPVELDVSVPVPEFRVRNLLALEPGQVIETEWAHGQDVPLAAGETQVAWSEFEVMESQLGVRLTRLA